MIADSSARAVATSLGCSVGTLSRVMSKKFGARPGLIDRIARRTLTPGGKRSTVPASTKTHEPRGKDGLLLAVVRVCEVLVPIPKGQREAVTRAALSLVDSRSTLALFAE